MPLTDNELRAIADIMRDRLSRVSNGAQEVTLSPPEHKLILPSPHIVNEVQSPEVHVTNQVAVPPSHVHNDINFLPMEVAVNRTNELLAELTDAVKNVGEMLSQVVQVVAAIKMRAVFKSPEVPVVFPDEPLKIESRPKRKIRITHDDGTQSVLEEI